MEVGALRSGDPDRLGSYALIGRVGEGGQGAVFLGVDDDGHQVAIKLLHADLTSDDKARARFLRELEVAKKVAPFCTAQVIDADVDGDRPYIVSEYVPGPSLNQQVLENGPLDGAGLDRLAVGTATALAAIHQAKIVHRDFKPHNVLIGPDGPRVIDFGVARAISGGTTLTSRVIGTPSYMAPEQISGDEVGTPADVFCWAATLVFAATGEPPFGQDSIPAVINRILNEEPDLGGLEGPLRALVLDCLEKEPARRPGARQVLMRLLGHEETSPLGAPAEVPHPTGDTDETAMLAAGSVRAAEVDDGELFPSDADYDDDRLFEDAPAAFHDGGPSRDGRSGEGAAGKTLPRDFAAARHAGDGRDTVDSRDAPEGRGLRRVLAGSGRSAALAGAAALFVAIVVVSSVLALGSRDNGKAGQKVSDPSAPPASSDVLPSRAPSTSEEPAEETETPSYRPTSPTWTPSESPSGTPTDTGSPSPTTTKTTTPPPDPSGSPD
ncbi:serine/threonine protein kinase, partial [Actinomadura soli]